MTSNNIAVSVSEVHPFERAELGKAPFRVIGSAERTFQAAPGEPVKPGGCCKYCYQGIKYAAVIQSADGKVFDVGLDCVRKVDMVAWQEAREFQRAELRAAREALRSEARERGAKSRAEQAAERAAVEARAESEWRAREPELATMIDALRSDDGFAGAIAGKALRQAQVECQVDAEIADKVRSIYAERTASGYVGTVGKRETFEGTYLGSIAFESSFGTQLIHRIRIARADGSHALMVWKSGSGLRADNGATVRFKATVKSHAEYRGIAQTSVTRLTVV